MFLKCLDVLGETLKKIKNPQLLLLESLTIPLYTGGETIMKGLEIQVKGKLSYLNWNNKVELNSQLIWEKTTWFTGLRLGDY